MKTPAYNPSPLEVDFANALFILQKEIQKHLQDSEVARKPPEIYLCFRPQRRRIKNVSLLKW